jgi:hypothetical protein
MALICCDLPCPMKPSTPDIWNELTYDGVHNYYTDVVVLRQGFGNLVFVLL